MNKKPAIALKEKLQEINYDTHVAGLELESLGRLLISSNGPNNGMAPKDYVGLGLVLEKLGQKLTRMASDLDHCSMSTPEDLKLRVLSPAPLPATRSEKTSKGEGISNAHLIAAAPELLEACKEALGGIVPGQDDGTEEMLLAAIAKAEGRERA